MLQAEGTLGIQWWELVTGVGLVDAHACWHAATVPLTVLFYGFLEHDVRAVSPRWQCEAHGRTTRRRVDDDCAKWRACVACGRSSRRLRQDSNNVAALEVTAAASRLGGASLTKSDLLLDALQGCKQ